jgi:hypothetical protein
MASFAKLNSENIVEQVISVHNNELLDNGIESEQKGIQFLKFLYGQDTIWKQTSYNTRDGVHTNNGTPLRKNHAGIGYTYDQNRDAFISPKPFNSWILDEITCSWKAPILKPETYTMGITNSNGDPIKDIYRWNEGTLNWEIFN